MSETTFQFTPKGPFELAFQNKFFSGWPTLKDNQTIVMAFPVEGWQSSAAVTIKQNNDKSLLLTVYGEQPEKARDQALAALSLDEDGNGWQAIGKKDPVLKELQDEYRYMRPSLFHSPYEATAHFMIGHRISMVQGRKIRQNMAEQLGEKFTIEGQDFYSFPAPEKLLSITEFKVLNLTKIERLQACAQAALDGLLDRAYLRSLPEDEALKKIETIPGIGSFFSQGILDRGAGRADGFTHDDLTYHAIALRYGLGKSLTKDQVLEIADKWRPYRMWAVVLHHVWLRESGNLPKRTFSKQN